MADIVQNAILQGDETLVTSLVSSGIRVNDTAADGRTLLNTAIAQGNDAIIDTLIGAGADIQQPDSFRVDCARLQPIHYAARYGRMDLISDLLTYVDVDQPDEGNCTPLHHAAVMGHINIAQLLLDFGSDINWQSNSGRTPLWKAAEKGHRYLVRVLCDRGAHVNLPNKVGENVLFEVIRDVGLLSIMEDILDLGVDISWKDIEGNIVLHKACALGNTTAVASITKAGGNISEVNDYGNTPLHNAAMFDNLACVMCLLNCGNGKLLGVKNNVGQSALYLAMLHQQVHVVEVLHDVGARLSHKELFQFEQYESTRSNDKLLLWERYLHYFRKPKTLILLCIVKTRNCVRAPVAESINLLPLPASLQKSILLEDIINR